MLNSRLRIILRELMATKSAVTGEYLASINQVTKRTIRSDIKELVIHLEDNGATIIPEHGKGYSLIVDDEVSFRSFLQTYGTVNAEQKSTIPESREERVTFIINHLLLTAKYIKLEELSDMLYVSKSTVQNDLKYVKAALADYDIQLESRPNYGFFLVGDELKIRFCLAEYLFNHEQEKPMSFTSFTFKDMPDIDQISTIIKEQIDRAHIVLSDIAINNLMIHIAIAYKRIKNGYEVSVESTDLESIIAHKEYQVAKSIAHETEKVFSVSLPQAEIAYIAIHLLGTKLISKTQSSGQVVKDVMDERILHLVQMALDRIESELHLGIHDDNELVVALALHLKPAISRYKYGMNVRNPMIEDIKKNYPLAFEAGVVAGLAIKEESGFYINENEVGYLALHIGSAMERRKLTKGPKRCLIVCATGLGTAQLIYYRLKNYFGESLKVVGTTEYYQLSNQKLQDIDFIVSSIPIEEFLSVPVIEVNAILGEADLQRIEKNIIEKEDVSQGYFKEELMYLQQQFTTKEAVLEFFQDELKKKRLVNHSLLEAIEKREQVSPTAYGNLVAIPHPIRPLSTRTFLTVCTLKKPIVWNEKNVQFVCLLSIKKNSKEDLQPLYKMLGKIVDSPEMVQELLKARTFTEFMRVIE